jgi:hypothetical protein
MHTPDPAAAGFDPDRLDRLAAAIESDIQSERYDGCELVVCWRSSMSTPAVGSSSTSTGG